MYTSHTFHIRVLDKNRYCDHVNTAVVSVCLKIKTVRVHARRNATQRVHVHERHADRSHTSWLPSLLKKLKRQTRQVRNKGNILTSCLRRREPLFLQGEKGNQGKTNPHSTAQNPMLFDVVVCWLIPNVKASIQIYIYIYT